EGQLQLLQSLECETAQGFLFARPLDPSKAADLLARGLRSQMGSATDCDPAPTPTPESEEAIPQTHHRETRISTGRWLSIAAGTLTVLALAALVTRFAGGIRPVDRSSPPAVLENAEVSAAPDTPLERAEESAHKSDTTPVIAPPVTATSAPPSARPESSAPN